MLCGTVVSLKIEPSKLCMWAKPWNCDITAIFFKPCKHKINSVVRQITTLLKFFCMNLFILVNINNIYSQRHLVVILTIFSSKMIGIFNNDEKLLSELF